MKVLLISKGVPTQKAPLNGIFEWDQALALAQNGVEVAYMALDFRKITDVRPWGVRTYKRQGIYVFELSLPTGIYRRGLPLLQALCYKMYQKVVQQWGKPDVMHTHFYFMGAIAAKLPSLTGIPLVHTEHSSKLNKPLSAISSLDIKLAKMAFAAASVVTAVSTAYAQVLAQNFAVKAQVVPNVLGLVGFVPEDNQITESPNHQAENSDTTFTWISVGRLIPSKGMSTLLDAFARTLTQCPQQKLWIIGDGPQKEALQAQIKQLGLHKQVELLGSMPRTQVLSHLQKAHAFVLLSETETFGVSYVEAISMGLPVVATHCGGPADFVHAGNGLLVPVGDAAAASNAMLYIEQNYQTYNREQMSQKMVQLYAPQSIAQQLKQIYQTLLDEATH
jgi:glycosyltransferase involved in cell wall biosynthesis